MIPSPRRRALMNLYTTHFYEFGGDFGDFLNLLGSWHCVFFENHGVAESLEEFAHFDDVGAGADGGIERADGFGIVVGHVFPKESEPTLRSVFFMNCDGS